MSPVDWSGKANQGVQGSDHAKRAPDDRELPLQFTLFTPSYRALIRACSGHAGSLTLSLMLTPTPPPPRQPLQAFYVLL